MKDCSRDCLPRHTWPMIESSFFIATACKLHKFPSLHHLLTGRPNFFVHDCSDNSISIL